MMRRLKFINFLVCLFIGVCANAQTLSKEKVQENINAVFNEYTAMKTVLKSWEKSKDLVALDSIKWLRETYANSIIEKSKKTQKFATEKEGVLLQFYHVSASVDVLKLYQKNRYLMEAKLFSQNYLELLSYKAKVDGQGRTNGILRNLNREKIELIQYNYLIQLYNVANGLQDKGLLKYTSEQLAENPRASLYNQVVATMYLFKVNFLESNHPKAFEYGDKFLNKFSNLSFENREKFTEKDAHFRRYFVVQFYESARSLWKSKSKLINSQSVSQYAEIGEKYNVVGLQLHMQGLLVDLKEITGKKDIEDLVKKAENLKLTKLTENLNESLKALKSNK